MHEHSSSKYVDHCNVCNVGSYQASSECAEIGCNVREFADESFTVWRCHECQSLHCRQPIDFERYYKNYPLGEQGLSWLTRMAYRNRLRLLRNAGLTREASVLDYGCGGGLFLKYLQGRGYRAAVGFDPYCDPKMPYRKKPTEKFDMVYSFGVIEHVDCPTAFLETNRDFLTESGRLVIATPEATGLGLQSPNCLLMHQPYHRHILSLEALIRLARKVGLKSKGHSTRNWMDTWHPGMNSRFVTDYIKACGGLVDCLFEPRRVGMFLTSPLLWKAFWFGYWYPPSGYMVCEFGLQ